MQFIKLSEVPTKTKMKNLIAKGQVKAYCRNSKNSNEQYREDKTVLKMWYAMHYAGKGSAMTEEAWGTIGLSFDYKFVWA